MKASAGTAKSDVRVDTVPDPKIEDPGDVIVKITATAICGSDLHLYDGYMPTMESGDVLGHEPMGDGRRGRQRRQEAEEGRPRGRPVHDLVRHLLVLQADRCSRCCDTSNPNAEIAREAMGQSPAGLFGFSHMLGGFAGGQAEYLRVPLRRRRPDQDRVRPARRAGAVPLRHLPDRLHGGRERRDRAGRHGRRLGLRAGRAVRHPERLDARRRPGDRHRPRPRAAGDGREARQGRDDQLRRRTRSTTA